MSNLTDRWDAYPFACQECGTVHDHEDELRQCDCGNGQESLNKRFAPEDRAYEEMMRNDDPTLEDRLEFGFWMMGGEDD